MYWKSFSNIATNSPKFSKNCMPHSEFKNALQAVDWLKDHGYQVGFNLMQVADRNEQEIKALAKLAEIYQTCSTLQTVWVA